MYMLAEVVLMRFTATDIRKKAIMLAKIIEYPSWSMGCRGTSGVNKRCSGNSGIPNGDKKINAERNIHFIIVTGAYFSDDLRMMIRYMA